MSQTVSGGCMCGAIRFEAEVAAREVMPCACSQCLRQNGGPWLGVHTLGAVHWQGAPASVRVSDGAARGFCGECGSTLFRQADGEAPQLSHGAMDDAGGDWRLLPTAYPEAMPDAFRLVGGRHA